MIFHAKADNTSELAGRFKEHTSKAIWKEIETHPSESRREWLLWMMEREATKNSGASKYQFWQDHNKPIKLWSTHVIEQKLNYIHNNPDKADSVDEQQHRGYSSAINYCGSPGAIEMGLL